MNSARTGSQTIKLLQTPTIRASAAVGSKMEGRGPLKDSFDFLSSDAYFGASSWEGAESAMQKSCFELALQKAKLKSDSLDFLFSGDLLNQCVGSAFAVKDAAVPYFGLYGACSTMAESLALAAMMVDGGFAGNACALTSSHFCSAERQFRLPLAYGGQRTPTAQWTATAAGAAIVSAEDIAVHIPSNNMSTLVIRLSVFATGLSLCIVITRIFRASYRLSLTTYNPTFIIRVVDIAVKFISGVRLQFTVNTINIAVVICLVAYIIQDIGVIGNPSTIIGPILFPIIVAKFCRNIINISFQ